MRSAFLNRLLSLPAFGLDISEFSLKVAALGRKGKYLHLETFGALPLLPAMIQNGEIKKPQDLSRLWESGKVFRGKPLKLSRVVVSVPEEVSFVRIVQLPVMNPDELQKAIQWEAEANIPLTIDQVYLDYEMLAAPGRGPAHTDVLLVATPKPVVDSVVEFLKLIKLTPIAIEVESQAIARALVPGGTSEEPLMLVDLGEHGTTIMVFAASSLQFTSSIPISGRMLTEAVAKALGLDFSQAEREKIQIGLDERRNPQIAAALRPPLSVLIDEIKTRLDFYASHTFHAHTFGRTRAVGKVVLSGGGANLKGISALLSSGLGLPVELGNPWVNILEPPLKEIPALPYEESLSYTTALGLALRGLSGE
ncbi:type IV pilus assembly protein PilM [Candidatus Azambacteria bacterium]|nr:type IV pilus assembly protein PilM [Candidatus Azambacteria bacterium]